MFFDRAAARCLPTIVAGDGIYLIDDRGRRLLDVCSGRAPGLWGSMAVYSEKIPAPLTFRAASPESAAAVSLAAIEETIDRIGPARFSRS